MTRNKVEICGVDTAKLPVLTNTEMRELFHSLQQHHDRSAREIGEWQPASGTQCHSAF